MNTELDYRYNDLIMKFGKAVKAKFILTNLDSSKERRWVRWSNPKDDKPHKAVTTENLKLLAFEWLNNNEVFFMQYRKRQKNTVSMFVAIPLLESIMKAAVANDTQVEEKPDGADGSKIKQTIKLQIEFANWLKEKGIFNPFASVAVMQASYKVWYLAVKNVN